MTGSHTFLLLFGRLLEIMNKTPAEVFKGQPCIHGHGRKRYVVGGRCVECVRAYWKTKNATPQSKKDRHDRYKRDYSRPEVREAYRSRGRAYNENPDNKEAIKRHRINFLNNPKNKEKIARWSKASRERQIKNPKNKEAKKKYDRERYWTHREERLRYFKERSDKKLRDKEQYHV